MEGLGAMYRNVKTSIWHDEKFFGLSDVAQLVWFHVYTNPLSNGLGLYHAPIEGLAASKRMDLERYREGYRERYREGYREGYRERYWERYREGLREGLFKYDKRFQTVYFPNYLKHNKPANPNVMQRAAENLSIDSRLAAKTQCFQKLRRFGQRLPGTLPGTFRENWGNHPPNQEQEQEE